LFRIGRTIKELYILFQVHAFTQLVLTPALFWELYDCWAQYLKQP